MSTDATLTKTSGEPLLVVKDLVKTYANGTTVLNGVNFEVHAGDVFAILGGSGCGKSTLLNILIGVDEPSEGSVLVLGEDIHRIPRQRKKALMRHVGVLFQSGALLQSLTVAENVALPF